MVTPFVSDEDTPPVSFGGTVDRPWGRMGFMADDEIERLLREVADSTNPGRPALPDKPASPGRWTGALRGRLGFAIVAGVALGVAGWLIGLFLPFVGAGSMGTGAAIGAFVTGLIGGGPRWLDR